MGSSLPTLTCLVILSMTYSLHSLISVDEQAHACHRSLYHGSVKDGKVVLPQLSSSIFEGTVE